MAKEYIFANPEKSGINRIEANEPGFPVRNFEPPKGQLALSIHATTDGMAQIQKLFPTAERDAFDDRKFNLTGGSTGLVPSVAKTLWREGLINQDQSADIVNALQSKRAKTSGWEK
jgi:hypothetical protein